MTSPSRALVLRFGTDLEPAKRAVSQLASSIATNMATVSASALASSRTLDSSFGGAALRLATSLTAVRLAAVAAALAIGAAVGEARRQLEEMGEIADKAGSRGVSAEFFQQFTAESRKAKVAVSDLEGALARAFDATKEKLDEVNPLFERLREFFRAGFFGAEDGAIGFDLFKNAATQDDKIRAVLTAMMELERAGQRLAAFDIGEKMFGAGFVDLIRQGKTSAEEMLATIDRAKGENIFSDELVKRAEEIDRQLKIAHETLEQNLRPAWAGLADTALSIKSIWAEIVGLIAQAAGAANQVGAIGSTRLQDKQTQLSNLNKLMDSGPATLFGFELGFEERNRRALRDKLTKEILADVPNFDPMMAGSLPAEQPDIPLPRSRPDAAPKATTAAATSIDRIESFISMLEKSRDVVQAELANLGKSNAEREKAIALAQAEAAARMAGRSLTDEERAKIDELAASHAALNDRLRDQRQAIADAAETYRYFGNTAADALGDLIFKSRSLTDLMKGLVEQFARAALQAGFTGTGPLASFFGTAPSASAGAGAVGGLFGIVKGLFAGGFAEGGYIPAGHWGMAGEMGPEPVFGGRTGVTVQPAGRGGVNVTIHSAPVFQAGMTPTDIAAVSAAMERNNEQLKQDIYNGIPQRSKNDPSWLS